MIAIIVLLSIAFMVLLDIIINRKPKEKLQTNMYYHPVVGLTMADGGEKIKNDKIEKDS